MCFGERTYAVCLTVHSLASLTPPCRCCHLLLSPCCRTFSTAQLQKIISVFDSDGQCSRERFSTTSANTLCLQHMMRSFSVCESCHPCRFVFLGSASPVHPAGDGYIDFDEFVRMMAQRGLGSTPAASVAAFSTPGSAAPYQKQALEELQQELVCELRDAFRVFDRDGDG